MNLSNPPLREPVDADDADATESADSDLVDWRGGFTTRVEFPPTFRPS